MKGEPCVRALFLLHQATCFVYEKQLRSARIRRAIIKHLTGWSVANLSCLSFFMPGGDNACT